MSSTGLDRGDGSTARAAPARAALAGLRSIWTSARPVEQWCYRIGMLLIVAGLFHLGVFAVRGGPWQGPVSWRKPTTFGLSFGLTLITLTWVATYLPLGARARRLWLGLLAAACIAEVALITLQAWRRVPSHYNLETPFDAVIARTLAAGGAALIAIVAALTIASFRANPGVPPSLRLAVRAGFLALLFALVVGAIMIARGLALVFAGHQQEAYAAAGSLKPAHAVTMHGILVLPALAWLLSFTSWDESRRLALIWIAIAGYALLAGVVIAITFAGIAPGRAPFIAGTFAALGTLALCGVGVIALAGLLRRATNPGRAT